MSAVRESGGPFVSRSAPSTEILWTGRRFAWRFRCGLVSYVLQVYLDDSVWGQGEAQPITFITDFPLDTLILHWGYEKDDALHWERPSVSEREVPSSWIYKRGAVETRFSRSGQEQSLTLQLPVEKDFPRALMCTLLYQPKSGPEVWMKTEDSEDFRVPFIVLERKVQIQLSENALKVGELNRTISAMRSECETTKSQLAVHQSRVQTLAQHLESSNQMLIAESARFQALVEQMEKTKSSLLDQGLDVREVLAQLKDFKTHIAASAASVELSSASSLAAQGHTGGGVGVFAELESLKQKYWTSHGQVSAKDALIKELQDKLLEAVGASKGSTTTTTEAASSLPKGVVESTKVVVERVVEKVVVDETRIKALEAELARLQEEIDQYRSGKIPAQYLANNPDFVPRSIFNDTVKEKRSLQKKVWDLKGNIVTYCRVRPAKSSEDMSVEMEGGVKAEAVRTSADDGTVTLTAGPKDKQRFEFDKVFGMESTQEEVFTEIESCVSSVLEGFNISIFAYGQTGSGKTHTMEGPDSNPGVYSRAFRQLFQTRDDSNGRLQCDFQLSVVEIYNEVVRDLLAERSNGKSPELEVRERPDHTVCVPGLTQAKVTDMEEVNRLMSLSRQNRSVAKTNMNEHSSRSHCVVMMDVEVEDVRDKRRFKGRLHLVDLAGSERVNASGVTGSGFTEACNINSSLLALGNVINELASGGSSASTNSSGSMTPRGGKRFVNYRDSKLTYLMRDSLGAPGSNSKTLMFICVSPCTKSCSESLNSLRFGARAKSVELGQAKKTLVASPSRDSLVSSPASLNSCLNLPRSPSRDGTLLQSSAPSSPIPPTPEGPTLPTIRLIEESQNSRPRLGAIRSSLRTSTSSLDGNASPLLSGLVTPRGLVGRSPDRPRPMSTSSFDRKHPPPPIDVSLGSKTSSRDRSASGDAIATWRADIATIIPLNIIAPRSKTPERSPRAPQSLSSLNAPKSAPSSPMPSALNVTNGGLLPPQSPRGLNLSLNSTTSVRNNRNTPTKTA